MEIIIGETAGFCFGVVVFVIEISIVNAPLGRGIGERREKLPEKGLFSPRLKPRPVLS